MANCLYCSSEIIGKRSNAKYCSDPCRDTAEKRRQRERKGLATKAQRGPYAERREGQWNDSYGRRFHLKKTFGITLEQYNEMLEKQNYCCAICEKHTLQSKRNLAVDHNHVTGEIRGLLCSYCNHRLIGRHRDGVLLRKMADYVEQGTGLFVPEQPKKPRKKKS